MDSLAIRQFQCLVRLDATETSALREIGLVLAPAIPGIAQTFYNELLAEADLAPFLDDKLWALPGICERWISGLFSGAYSDSFWEEQRLIGVRHAQIGVPHPVLLAGFSRIRGILTDRISTLSPASAISLRAMNKILDVSQYLAGGAYVRETEHAAVKSLRRLTQHFSTQEFFQESARLACRLVGADGAALVLREDQFLRYTFFEGLPEAYRQLGSYQFPASEGAAGAALAGGEPIYVPDYPNSRYAMPVFVTAGLRASLALPLLGPDGALGVLAVSWFDTPAPERLPEDQWDYLRLLGDMLSGILYRSQLESRLESLATRDTLTGLPNRRALPERVAGAMARAARHDSLMALVFIDLDGFKPINDRLGHAMGDATLKAVADSLSSVIRSGDTVARYAGDEFIVILEEAGYMAEIEAVTDRLLRTIRREVVRDDIILPLSASVGVTVYPFDDGPAEALIHHADLAMYRAKQGGGDTWRLYEGEAEAQDEQRALLGELRQAMERGEFRLYWQPIVDLTTRQITGAEALLRWQHPERGLLAPAAFLDALENCPLIRPVGHWILETALRQAERWHRSGRAWDVHINLAAAQLEEVDFARHIGELLSQFPDLHRNAIWLEIVERVALEDVAAVAFMIRSCRNLGVHFTLDDFGTGAAAIQYLVELECSGFKMDKSLVSPMRNSAKHHTLVRTLVDMAESLSIKVVAEGVEDAETAEQLRALGVTHAQGFHFSKPVATEELERLFA